jgi:hypothetical protein
MLHYNGCRNLLNTATCAIRKYSPVLPLARVVAESQRNAHHAAENTGQLGGELSSRACLDFTKNAPETSCFGKLNMTFF